MEILSNPRLNDRCLLLLPIVTKPAQPYLINGPMQPAHQKYTERKAVCDNDQDGVRRKSACSVSSGTIPTHLRHGAKLLQAKCMMGYLH